MMIFSTIIIVVDAIITLCIISTSLHTPPSFCSLFLQYFFYTTNTLNKASINRIINRLISLYSFRHLTHIQIKITK